MTKEAKVHVINIKDLLLWLDYWPQTCKVEIDLPGVHSVGRRSTKDAASIGR